MGDKTVIDGYFVPRDIGIVHYHGPRDEVERDMKNVMIKSVPDPSIAQAINNSDHLEFIKNNIRGNFNEL